MVSDRSVLSRAPSERVAKKRQYLYGRSESYLALQKLSSTLQRALTRPSRSRVEAQKPASPAGCESLARFCHRQSHRSCERGPHTSQARAVEERSCSTRPYGRLRSCGVVARTPWRDQNIPKKMIEDREAQKGVFGAFTGTPVDYSTQQVCADGYTYALVEKWKVSCERACHKEYGDSVDVQSGPFCWFPYRSSADASTGVSAWGCSTVIARRSNR